MNLNKKKLTYTYILYQEDAGMSETLNHNLQLAAHRNAAIFELV